jgi:N-acetylglucosaminyldiphosphoundecaprenol N-acetyl-beta-D-mannosaminyltransferase
LFVALGAPKQEIWMYDNYKKINCVSIGIGAAIDFISGNKKMAPKFMEFLGLAWLFRLLSEPRRLFWRYFVTNTLFIILFFFQIIGLNKYK